MPKKQSFIQPLDTFCCGFTLDFGIQCIIVIHTLVSFFYMATAWCNIVLDQPTMGAAVDFGTQAFNCGFALASLPFIVSGISGVKYQIESHLRIYLYWLMLSVFLDFIFATIIMVKTTCSGMPEFLDAYGGAFACGMMRIASAIFIIMCLVAMSYALFTVWSRCEELKVSMSEEAFDGLLKETRRAQEAMVFQHRSGLFGTGPVLTPAHPVVYGSVASPAFMGSARIFNGNNHDVNFPPQSASQRRK